MHPELEPYRPSSEAPWNRRRASHLLRRIGFLPSEREIRLSLEEGPGETIEKALHARPPKALSTELEATARRLASGDNVENLRGWWVQKLVRSSTPLRDRMTLFWQNHFATSQRKVKNPRFMLDQHLFLEENALGNFRDLLVGISKDPAMLVWLDGENNRKGSPNENFARELFELFALGEGNYSESDIREAARAFTGWRKREGTFRFYPARHDGGPKTIFGKTGKFDSDDVIDLCMSHEATGRFLSRKLFLELAGFAPDSSVIDSLSGVFRRSRGGIRELVETVVSSRLFFSERALRCRVLPPVEYLVGTVRALEGRMNGFVASRALVGMGQALFAPPSVAGWKGRRSWLNTAALLSRYQAMRRWTAKNEGPCLDASRLCSTYDLSTGTEAVDFVVHLLLGDETPNLAETIKDLIGTRLDPVESLRESVFLAASSPAYQMG